MWRWWRWNCGGGDEIVYGVEVMEAKIVIGGKIVVDGDGIVIDGGSEGEIVDDGDDDSEIVMVMEWGEGNNGGIRQRY